MQRIPEGRIIGSIRAPTAPKLFMLSKCGTRAQTTLRNMQGISERTFIATRTEFANKGVRAAKGYAMKCLTPTVVLSAHVAVKRANRCLPSITSTVMETSIEKHSQKESPMLPKEADSGTTYIAISGTEITLGDSKSCATTATSVSIGAGSVSTLWKVQRLSRKGVQASAWKRLALARGEDIVSTYG